MKYVYATAYNIKTTLSFVKTDNEEINRAMIRDVILTKNLFLSNKDLTILKTLHVFLQSPNEFISQYFKGWEDSFQFLIEKPPAYHIDSQCPKFLKDFYNIEIPDKIREKDLIAEARRWAELNRSLITPSGVDKFCAMFMEHFNYKFDVGLTREDLKSVARPNSGKQIVNSSLDDIELEIKKIIHLIDQRFTKKQQDFFNREYREKGYKYDGAYKNNGSYIELRLYWDLQFWTYSVVKPLIKNIEDYIFLKLNQDHKYDQNVLDFLKFVPCRGCGSI